MNKINDILSLRIVSVDHYMHSPINGLDPCYADYRGSAINQVSKPTQSTFICSNSLIYYQFIVTGSHFKNIW